jgi:hypothetical protein
MAQGVPIKTTVNRISALSVCMKLKLAIYSSHVIKKEGLGNGDYHPGNDQFVEQDRVFPQKGIVDQKNLFDIEFRSGVS